MEYLQPGQYLHYIRQFVDKGDVVEVEKDVPDVRKDALLEYLSDIMHNPLIQAKVLSSRLVGQIFYETVGRFVLECLHAENLQTNVLVLNGDRWRRQENGLSRRRGILGSHSSMVLEISMKRTDSTLTS